MIKVWLNMFSLVKHHFLAIDLTSYIVVPLMIIMGYLINVPPMFLFSITVISIPIIVYFFNYKSHANRFLVSLPVSTIAIIRSQYVFAVLLGMSILLLQRIIMTIVDVMFGTIFYIYDWRDVIILVSLALIVPAIVIPIYQLVRSFVGATVIVGVLYISGILFSLPLLVRALNMEDYINFNALDPGVHIVVEQYIPFQPYPLLLFIAIILFFVSMMLSYRLYASSDH